MSTGEMCKSKKRISPPEKQDYNKINQNLNNPKQFFSSFALSTLSLNDQS